MVVVSGILVCFFLVGFCAGADCGCAFDTSPPDYGWNSPGFSDSHDSSNGGSSLGGADAGPSDSGSSSSSGTSASDSGSSGSSSGGGSSGISGSESSTDSALLLATQGATYYRQGDMNQSLRLLNKSLSIDPYSVRAWMIKGDVLSAMGRYDEAVIAYSQVFRIDPSDGSASAKKGDALMNAGEYQEAIISYDRALTMDPGQPGVQSNRSLAQQLDSGVIKANISVTEPNETAMLNPGKDLAAATIPVTTLPMTTSPVSEVPITTKSAVSVQVPVIAIIIAGILSIGFRKC